MTRIRPRSKFGSTRQRVAAPPLLIRGWVMLSIWMQTTGTTQFAVRQCSLVCVRTPAQDGHCARGLLYLAAVRDDRHVQNTVKIMLTSATCSLVINPVMRTVCGQHCGRLVDSRWQGQGAPPTQAHRLRAGTWVLVTVVETQQGVLLPLGIRTLAWQLGADLSRNHLISRLCLRAVPVVRGWCLR
jgi:hypothetical protein